MFALSNLYPKKAMSIENVLAINEDNIISLQYFLCRNVIYICNCIYNANVNL